MLSDVLMQIGEFRGRCSAVYRGRKSPRRILFQRAHRLIYTQQYAAYGYLETATLCKGWPLTHSMQSTFEIGATASTLLHAICQLSLANRLRAVLAAANRKWTAFDCPQLKVKGAFLSRIDTAGL